MSINNDTAKAEVKYNIGIVQNKGINDDSDFESFGMTDRIDIATMRNNFLAITKGVQSKETFDDLNIRDKLVWSLVYKKVWYELQLYMANKTDISKATLFVVARQSYQTAMTHLGEAGQIPLCSNNWYDWSDEDKNLWSSVFEETMFTELFNPKSSEQNRNNIVKDLWKGLLNKFNKPDVHSTPKTRPPQAKP